MDSGPLWVLAGVALGFIGWLSRRSVRRMDQPPARSFAVVGKEQAGRNPYPYIFVNEDGSARELHANERKYLETAFHPTDGARPYVKDQYSDRDGWGSPAGFLSRAKLPPGATVEAAPVEDRSRSLSKEELAELFLRGKELSTEGSGGAGRGGKPNR